MNRIIQLWPYNIHIDGGVLHAVMKYSRIVYSYQITCHDNDNDNENKFIAKVEQKLHKTYIYHP